MKLFRTIVAGIFLLAIVSCSFKPIWDLEGKWKQVDGNETIEFLKKGKVKVYNNSRVYEANYSFVDKDHFKIDFANLGSIKVAFKVSGKDLTITTEDGQTLKFKKVVGKEKTVEKNKEHQKEKEKVEKEKPKHQKATIKEKKETKSEHQPEHE